jgi:hypothetical protein
VSLSPTWEPLYLDYIAQVTGTSLDVQVEDVPLTAGEVFQVDNLSIRVVSTPPNSAAGLAREAEAGATAAEEPLFGAAGPMRPLVIPNPARGRATIDFATSRPGPMRAELFDASGRRIRRLANGPSFAAGRHSLAVDGRDDTGAALPAGVYFYRIESVDGIATGRFVLMK